VLKPVNIMGRLTCTVKEACAAVPCGRTHLYKMIRAGLVQHEKYCAKTLIVIASMPRAPEDSLSLPQIQALHLVRHFRLPMPIAETIARLAFTESRR
jgi:hypothetical protein